MVRIGTKIIENYSSLSSFSGEYIRTTSTKHVNHWTKQDDQEVGIWRDPITKYWCVGYIYVDNSEECSVEQFNCDCQFTNPTITNCPYEKTMSNWEYINEMNQWSKDESNDFQVQPMIGNYHFPSL